MTSSMDKPPSRRRHGSGVRPDDAIIGALGGAGLTYYGLVAHSFAHPLHWLAAAVGGVVGGVGVWLYAERDRVRAGARRLRPRRRSESPSRPAGGRRKA
jgi:hypothetical protein